MKIKLLAVLMLVASTNTFAHGSSHPRWRYCIDINNVEYMQCDNRIVSMVDTVQQYSDSWQLFSETKPLVNTHIVTKVVKFKEFSVLVDLTGKRCSDYWEK
jgi:hypothetical protein